MGNTSSNTSKSNSKLSKMIRSKLKKTETNDSDNFIINHFQNNKDNIIPDIESLDPRRVVFVSLLGLFQSWTRIPSVVLYSSILLMPLKREWIYNPSKYTQELQHHFVSKLNTFYDKTATNQFIQLLKWKDTQQLVIWMLDDYSAYKTSNTSINPFWYYVSDYLSALYDPITGNKYNKLNLNEEWWRNKEMFTSKHNTKTASILSELYFLTMKYNTVQEILYQSNKHLHPIKTYNNIADRISATVSECIYDTEIEYVISPDDIYIDDEEKDDFVFAADYDAYCMDTNDIENEMIQCINSNCDIDYTI